MRIWANNIRIYWPNLEVFPGVVGNIKIQFLQDNGANFRKKTTYY